MTSEFLPFARPRPGTQPPYLYPDYQSTQKRSPRRAPIRVEHTLSETTGPGFADLWAGPDATDLTRQHSRRAARRARHRDRARARRGRQAGAGDAA